MKTLTCSVEVNAPAARVWDLITDIEHAHEFIPGIKAIEILGDKKSGLGLRWRETRVMFGKEATETLEITEWRPPREYAVTAANHGCVYRSIIRVVPQSRGCRVEFEFGATPVTILARIMGTLMAPLMTGSIRKMLVGDLEAIKQHAEETAQG